MALTGVRLMSFPVFNMSSSPVTPPASSTPARTTLPVRTIPGSYGLPLLGPLWDRLDYFWFNGPETFLRKRMDKYKSTVFRTNVPPTFPFFLNVNPKMIAVLDCKAFATLFDMDYVEKKNVLIGDFMPSTGYTGNMRVGVYLDPSEPKHAQVKDFCADILKRSSKVWTSELLSNLETMWSNLEKEVSKKSKPGLFFPLERCIFRFLTKSIIGADPEPSLGQNAFINVGLWLAPQIIPTVKIGRFQPLEEILLHSFAYPSFLVQPFYNKLYQFVKKQGKQVVDRGVIHFGLTEDEAIHNLLFVLGFNAFGGFTVMLPSLMDRLGSDKTGLQDKLRADVRRVLCSPATPLNFDSVTKMELVESFVYESLRLSPPVPSQFARARKDFMLHSHDSAYEIKKGELLFGYQPLVMRDPRVFDEPETFKADRFTKQKGKELLDYLYWSNGPQTGCPGSWNKQCSAKDHVVLTACMIVADIFRRYDSFAMESGSITAIEKRAR